MEGVLQWNPPDVTLNGSDLPAYAVSAVGRIGGIHASLALVDVAGDARKGPTLRNGAIGALNILAGTFIDSGVDRHRPSDPHPDLTGVQDDPLRIELVSKLQLIASTEVPGHLGAVAHQIADLVLVGHDLPRQSAARAVLQAG